MSTVTFDTHQFVKALQAKGFTPDQAEGINDALKNALQVAEVATVRDLKALEEATRRDIRELELRLTIKLGALMAGSIGVVAALVKLL
ncbi:MAG: DUF1640 domain-containing protein [Rhodocyclaceae bacterium]|nr:DUF1640 domain-containing protein [Rhodocyclaceae bacterium]